MKRILVAALLTLVGCARQPTTPAAPPPAVVVEPPLKTCVHTMHASDSFGSEAREMIAHASNGWATISAGRILLDVAYDLTADYLERHDPKTVDLLMPITSDGPIAKKLDEELARGNQIPVAATTTTLQDAKQVFLIVDRIDDEDALGIIAHEFGHVCGLPDIPSYGAVMSAVVNPQPVNEPTAIDIAVCRAFRLCQ